MSGVLYKRRDNTYCCVPQCRSHGTRHPTLSFHHFPSDLERKNTWVRALKMGKQASSRMCVCSKHFQKTDYFFPDLPAIRRRLKKTAIPSLHIPVLSTENVQVLQEKREKALCRKTRYDARSENDVLEPSKPSLVKDFNQLVPEVDEEDRMIAANILLQLSQSQDIDTPHFRDAASQVCSGDLETNVILKVNRLRDKELNSLTGIGSIQMLHLLSEQVQKELLAAPKRQLCVRERIVLTMMKMKLNLSFVVISILFGCTATTCSSIFVETVVALSSALKVAIPWQSKEEILCSLPACFKKFISVRVVLDCTEMTIERPRCLRCRINTYSYYKGNHTIKYLIGVSPGGIITFISKGYGGRASDKTIVEQSGVLQMLDSSIDSVMVDKGFLIDDLCAQNLINLIRPPFVRSSQLSALEATNTRSIARARVHVERVIQRIKVFKMLGSGKIPWRFLGLTDDLMTIAAGLANIGAPIFSEDKFNV